ncbi:MAG: imidazole glycerol phosphate synthase subunit HisH [Leptospiraceae bacterium]|nr:imidazole glycerol phosphate synthase subunit HisH [Leptospiraceae bacterium]MBP9164424.1 imidazole glycerol phosphate synthase subunit HisH [Leptospiraceae bacterium]
MKIAIINYGMGNLASVRRAIEDIGGDCFIAEHPSRLYDAHKIILPGVGSFSEGMDRLSQHGWVEAIHDSVQNGKTFLGICLGMQMLATMGEEGGDTNGLNLIPGRVVRMDKIGCSLRIPHVGWNEVHYKKTAEIFTKIPDGSDFYFVHSFAFVSESEDHLLATSPYELNVAAVIQKANVMGCQFHPEKSSKAGRQLLRNFLEFAGC